MSPENAAENEPTTDNTVSNDIRAELKIHLSHEFAIALQSASSLSDGQRTALVDLVEVDDFELSDIQNILDTREGIDA